MKMQMPEGKYMGVVRVGDKGQIVIPKELRDMFEIRPGDMLMILGDVDRGIALMGYDSCGEFLSQKPGPEGGEDRK